MSPIVQLYGSRKVATDPYPQVRKTAAETDLSSGVGLDQARGRAAEAQGAAWGQVGQLGGVLLNEDLKRREEAKSTATTLKLLELDNQATRYKHALLYDESTGALKKRGMDAQDQPERADEAFQTYMDALGKDLGHNPELEVGFARLRYAHGNDIHDTLMTHAAREQMAFATSELGAHVELQLTEAVTNAGDPRKVGLALTSGEIALRKVGPTLGWPKEEIDNKVAAFKSATHVGVIEQLVAQHRTGEAEVYFAHATDEITGAGARAQMTKLLETANVLGQGQAAADKILRAGGTQTEQLKRAEGYAPEVRREAEQRIRQAHNDQENAAREAEASLLDGAYNTISSTHDVASLDAKTRLALGAHLPGLEAYARALSAGRPIQTDLKVWTSMREQADTEPENFMKLNLQPLQGKLSEPDYQQLVNLQMAMRNNDRTKVAPLLDGWRTDTQILNNTLSAYGIPTEASQQTPAQASAIAQLQRMVDRRVDVAQQSPDGKTPGKKVTPTEKQQILDELLGQEVTVKGSWWNIWPGGKSVSDTQKRLIDVTIDDISAEDQASLTRALRDRHRPVTPQTIRDLYIELKVK